MSSANQAQQLLRQGRIEEAKRAYAELLERDPRHVEALNVLGLAAVRDGRTERGLDLLARAAEADPANPITHHNLGLAHEAAGNLDAAIESQQRAVRAAPDFHVARLYLGRALDRRGRAAEAAVQYLRALQDAQANGRWVDASTTPPLLRPAVERAVRFVRDQRRAAFDRLFEPLRARYGRESMRRVEQAVRIYLREEVASFPDARQQPTFLYFPGLPTSAYLDRRLFPWIEEYESRTAAIVEELRALLPSTRGRERVFTSDELERANLRGLDVPPSWNGYYFYRHGERRDENCAACPATAAALDALPLSHIREHGPEVLFSVFTPGTHLLPHRGVTNTRLVSHLPLIVPPDCALNVGGEVHEWQEGRVVVFDDTYEHEAWNRSDRTRVVLIADVWNPHLTPAERAAVTDLVADVGDFRASVESA